MQKILDQISFTIQDYLNDYGNIEKLIKKKGWSEAYLLSLLEALV